MTNHFKLKVTITVHFLFSDRDHRDLADIYGRLAPEALHVGLRLRRQREVSRSRPRLRIAQGSRVPGRRVTFESRSFRAAFRDFIKIIVGPFCVRTENK